MKILKFILKFLTHNKCDTCGFTKEDVYVTEVYSEAGCVECTTCIEAAKRKRVAESKKQKLEMCMIDGISYQIIGMPYLVDKLVWIPVVEYEENEGGDIPEFIEESTIEKRWSVDLYEVK